MNARCPKGTPQGHALAILIDKFRWRRDCLECLYTSADAGRQCGGALRLEQQPGARWYCMDALHGLPQADVEGIS
jgi:hypothetical protein